MVNKVVAGKRSRDPKTYTLTLRFSDLVWLGVGTALALSIFFLFGLLIGRGYVAATPEPAPVSDTMHAQQQAAPGAVTAKATDQGPAGTTDAEAEQAPQAEEQDVVLQPEDLNYPEKLAQTEHDAGDKDTTPARKTPGRTAKAPPAPQKTQAQAPARDSDSFAVPAPEAGETPFHYVYQVAAFKDQDAAEKLRDRLRERKMDAAVAEGAVGDTVWHRVKVRFTGTPSQTVPLRNAIEDVTGQKPIRTSKKPAQE